MLEKAKAEAPKVETPAEGEKGIEAQTTAEAKPAETAKKDKPSTD